MKAEVDKLDINKFVDVLIGFNTLKTKADYLDVDKLKTLPIYLKKLSDAVSKEVLKKTLYNKLNNLKNKIPDATTLIHINQYSTDKQSDVDKKNWRWWFSDYYCV